MTDTTVDRPDGYELHYRGDLRGRIDDQIVGPSLLGEQFVIEQVAYDETLDRTTAYLRRATADDFRKAAG